MFSEKSDGLILRSVKLSFVVTSIIFIAGCGTTIFSQRDTNPVIEDHANVAYGKTNVFATTASRRLAIISTDSKGKRLICSEPPPDVGEAFASAIAAGLSGAVTATNATGQKISGELAAQYGRSVATQIAPLLYRTQGLQFYRDSMYKLCIDRMNEWITESDYNAQKEAIVTKTESLINNEIEKVMKDLAPAFYTNVKAGEAKVNADDIVKILNAQKKSQSTSEDSQ